MKQITKIFKYGLGLLIPIALVGALLYWLYDRFKVITLMLLPQSFEYHWYFPIVVLFGMVLSIFVVGLIFKYITPLRYIKDKFEQYVINNIPLVNKVYAFGKEFADGFVADVKENGDLTVVQVNFAGQPSLGLLTDVRYNIIFVATAPNPLNGFVLRTSDYKIVDMTPVEYFKLLGSLGRVGGNKWL